VNAGVPAGPLEQGPPSPWRPYGVPPELAARASATTPALAPGADAAADPSDDDQGVPRLRRPVAGPASDEFDPTTWDPRLPPLGHPIAPRSRISLETDPEMYGTVETFPVNETTVALVMVGNPVVRGDDLTIKAQTLVVWLDTAKDAGLLGFGGLAGGSAKRVEPRPSGAGGAAGAGARSASVLPDAVIAIYAEGAVDLVSGDIAFRASELYVNDRLHRALLIEPRFDTTTTIAGAPTPVPIHVRAATMRTLAEGYAAFEQAETSTSRANDRIALEIRVLTMEEFGQAVAGTPTLLGFTIETMGSQRFASQSIVGRAERVPLAYVPEAAFGGPEGLADFPVRIRHLTAGSRSSFGRWGFVGVGARQEVGDRAYVDWTANAVGYTKRGLGLGEPAYERVDDGARRVAVEGIHRLGPVERERGHATLDLRQDRIGHIRITSGRRRTWSGRSAGSSKPRGQGPGSCGCRADRGYRRPTGAPSHSRDDPRVRRPRGSAA